MVLTPAESGTGRASNFRNQEKTKENADDENALLFFVYCFVYLFFFVLSRNRTIRDQVVETQLYDIDKILRMR
jgi:hypothetical protein